jgi:ABC-type oligopeptide transport system ATPase subunit
MARGVDNVSVNICRGEILGLVGESGSGKSTLGRAIIRLVEAQSGQVIFNGVDLLGLSNVNLKNARRDVQMIFQDPYASLNPRMTVFDTLAEPLLVHGLANKSNVVEQVNSLMDDVGLDRRFIRKYPHEFSGGQRQRIAIARAIALKPKLIIADEPVSALDVTIRAQILALLLELSQKHDLTMLFISHDMSVVRYLCDRVMVMQKGKLVEEGETEQIFSSPQQDYTRQLLEAIPTL